MAPTTHIFDDTGDAYDRTQCDESIKHGDVLVVERESVVGILLEAWPVAITSESGHFHTVKPEFDWAAVKMTGQPSQTYDLTESLRAAKAIAAEKGFL